jgi:hypothetical protein
MHSLLHQIALVPSFPDIEQEILEQKDVAVDNRKDGSHHLLKTMDTIISCNFSEKNTRSEIFRDFFRPVFYRIFFRFTIISLEKITIYSYPVQQRSA